MKKSKWLVLVLMISLIPILGFGNADPQPEEIVNIFKGQIDTSDINFTVLHGDIDYDRNCVNVGNGLTNCDAGIKTAENGVINFNYTHNMAKKSCLLPGQKVLMKVKNSQEVYVVR